MTHHKSHRTHWRFKNTTDVVGCSTQSDIKTDSILPGNALLPIGLEADLLSGLVATPVHSRRFSPRCAAEPARSGREPTAAGTSSTSMEKVLCACRLGWKSVLSLWRVVLLAQKELETWLHLDFVDWREGQSQREKYNQKILLRERPAPYQHDQQKRRISDTMSDHSLSS